jgi:hypothetical protein
MRTRLVRGCAILLALFAVSPLRASEGFEDLVNQVRSGASDAAFTAYIAASPVAYDLTVDEILYLSDLGVSAEMIKTAVDHGKKLSAGAPIETPVPPPIAEAPTAALSAPAPVMSAEPMPVVPATPVNEVPPPFVDLSGGTATVPPALVVVQEPVATAPPTSAPPPAITDVSYFYQTLAPYGSWLNLDDGWYWQPTVMVVNREWHPYCERGHWVYTDCGWLWQSDYSWGWAPFHYGRWRHHARYGWVWMPDTVWGPAWVVWRGGDSAVGWAPLPPGAVFESGGGFSFRGERAHDGFAFELNAEAFTFVESARFCEPALSRHRMQRAEQTRVYNSTTIIQNSYTVIDNRIVNHGPPVARIAGAMQREIRPLRILDQPAPSGRPPRPGQLANQTVSVFRPHVAPTARETPEAVAARGRALASASREAEPRHAGGVPGRPAAGVPQPALLDYGNGATVRSFSERGISSRGTTAGATVRPPSPPLPGPGAVAERDHTDLQRRAEASTRQRQAEEAVTRQRQAEEATARQHQQDAQRQTQDAVRRQDDQRRVQDAARQQDAQRRAQDLAHQKESQRQAQETARQQDAQRQAQDAQRRVLQTQRQTEEAAARQQEAAARQQEAQRRTQDATRQDEQRRALDAARERAQRTAQTPPPGAPPNVIQDYGNGQMTGAASARGASSRDRANRNGNGGGN